MHRIECTLNFVRETVLAQKRLTINGVDFKRVEDMILSDELSEDEVREFVGVEGYILRGAEKPYPFISDLGTPIRSAPVASTPAQEPPANTASTDKLDALSKKQLLALAEEYGLEVDAHSSKAQLIAALEQFAKSQTAPEGSKRLEDMSQEELYALADDMGLPVGQHWTKEQLLEAIQNG